MSKEYVACIDEEIGPAVFDTETGERVEFDLAAFAATLPYGLYGLEQGQIGYGLTPEEALLDCNAISDWQAELARK